MKEHIIFDRIEQYEEAVNRRPISLLPNLLLLSYVALGKQYDKLSSYSEQFLMSNPKINILVEDFVMLSSLANKQPSFADTGFRNICSIDPEEPYAHLMRLITNHSTENFYKAKIFLSTAELKKLDDFFQGKEPEEPYTFYRIPSAIGIKDNLEPKIRKALEKDPVNPVLRASLSELLLKMNKVEEAQKELDAVLSVYPDYIRALNIKAKLLQDYLEEEEKGIEVYKKIYELNPVSPYLKGIEAVFLNEDEAIMVNELKSIFRHDNPFIIFFKENFKVEQQKQETEENRKSGVEKTAEHPIPNGEPEVNKPAEEELSPLDEGYKHLSQGNHKKAIESFLRDLKKK